MAKLSEITQEQILSWGPCDPYANPAHLDGVLSNRPTVTAKDILDLDIPARDRIWVVMREESLPVEVLDAICGKTVDIKEFPADVKSDVAGKQVKNDIKRDQLIMADEAKGRPIRWASSAHMACAVKHAGIRSYDEEYDRQLKIIVEEVDKFLNS